MAERRSPLAPGQEAIGRPGYYPENVSVPSAEKVGPPYSTLVGKGHAKNPAADPSMGTAVSRTVDLERAGARYRIEMPVVAPVMHDSANATLGNTPVVQDVSAPTEDKNYAAGTNDEVSQSFYVHRQGESAMGIR